MAEKTGRFLKGVAAEELAANYLISLGFSILGERVRNPAGEIDLVAAHGDLVVFVEVKTRESVEDALYAITPRQQGRLYRAAEIWLAQGGSAWQEMRFDAILVSSQGMVRHLENILLGP